VAVQGVNALSTHTPRGRKGIDQREPLLRTRSRPSKISRTLPSLLPHSPSKHTRTPAVEGLTAIGTPDRRPRPSKEALYTRPDYFFHSSGVSIRGSIAARRRPGQPGLDLLRIMDDP